MVNWIKDDDLAKKKLGKLYCGRRKNLQKKVRSGLVREGESTFERKRTIRRQKFVKESSGKQMVQEKNGK